MTEGVPAFRYLRAPRTTHTPSAVVTFDVEGRQLPGRDGHVDTFRLAVASYDQRRRAAEQDPRTEWTTAHEARELWSWVTERARRSRHLTAFAHGLHYDYVTSRAHVELPALGWDPVRLSFSRGCRWLVYGKGSYRLTMVDTANYLPIPLADLGKASGRSKLKMPPADAPDRVWERYCRRDVEILRASMLHLLDWWDAQGFGRWGLTSASLAWSAWRTAFYTHRVLVHGDPLARRIEREALFGGRREIFHQGTLPEGTWLDLDFVSHYTATAGATDVPVALAGTVPRMSRARYEAVRERAGVIARCVVTTDEPLVPLRDEGLGIVYPVGTFRTTLAGPEIDLLLERGAAVKLERAAVYQLAPALEAWANWLLGRLYGRAKEPDELLRRLLKDWSQRLVGKFGQRASRPVEVNPRDPEQVVEEVTVTADGARVADVWRESAPADPMGAGEGRSAVPQVTAWVHSEARVRLWRAMEAVGFTEVAWVDTDGVMVRLSERSAPGIRAVAPQVLTKAGVGVGAVRVPLRDRSRPRRPAKHRATRWERDDPPGYERHPGQMIPKGVYSEVVVHLPQDYELDGRVVAKGLPRKARQVAERTFEVTYWPNIPYQLAHHNGELYERVPRILHLSDDYLRGWVLIDGRVLPLEYEIAGNRSRPVPWSRTRWRHAGARLLDRAQARRVIDRAGA